MSALLPDRHPNKDFFILDVSDASPKDDLATMEHPVYSLSVKPDMRELNYQHNGLRLRIVPSGKGLATIMAQSARSCDFGQVEERMLNVRAYQDRSSPPISWISTSMEHL